MDNLTLSSFSLLLCFITLAAFGQICMKIGLRGDVIPRGTSPLHTLFNILKFMTRPWVLAGLTLYVISAFMWLLLISRVKLSVAYPMMSMSYVLVTFLSVLILREKVKWKFAVAGLVFIAAGVSFIGIGRM